MGVPSAVYILHSDRYAIRTRNLQDWNLTRYRCANRSETCKEGRGRGTLQDALERVVLAARAPSQVRLHSLCGERLPGEAAAAGVGLASESCTKFWLLLRVALPRFRLPMRACSLCEGQVFFKRDHASYGTRHTSEESRARPGSSSNNFEGGSVMHSAAAETLGSKTPSSRELLR